MTAMPTLRKGRDLTGTVTTMDALLCQRTIAHQILDQRGHSLMVVKDNQPAVWAAIELVFRQPPLPQPTDDAQTVTTVEKGHGRVETRTLERTAALNGSLDCPGVGQVLRRTCERIRLTTGEVSRAVTYGVTSVSAAESTAAQIEAVWRGHWGIEKRVHYVRDVTLGEDAGQAYSGQTPHVLAALHNGMISLLRSHGVTQMADALRHHGASVQAALAFLNSPL